MTLVFVVFMLFFVFVDLGVFCFCCCVLCCCVVKIGIT